MFRNYFQIISSFALTILCNVGFCQTPSIQWQKCLGGSTIDQGYSVSQTSDGGYVVLGYTESNDGNVSGLHNTVSNYPDFWIVKLGNSGNIKWQKCLGGFLNDIPYCIQQTSDQGFIIAGSSNSNNGDVTGNHGQTDCWIVKLDSVGNLKWQKSFGGSNSDGANSIQQTTDGGYIVLGSTSSIDGDITTNHGLKDFCVIKIDSVGTLKWQKSFGGTNYDTGYSIQQTSDKGYIAVGASASSDGNVSGNHGLADYWLIKLDSLGNLKWSKSYGGTDSDQPHSVKQTADKGYILAGYSFSMDGDVTGHHPSSSDVWIVKTDSIGTMQWQKSLGGSMNEAADDVQQTSDGGYIICGNTASNDGDVSGFHWSATSDVWVVKLDAVGGFSWQKCLGGTGGDGGRAIQQTTDGGAIIAGVTGSNDGDVSGGLGGDDYWVVKLDNVNSVSSIQDADFNPLVFPNPARNVFNIRLSSKENGNVQIKIWDSQGKKVVEMRCNVSNGFLEKEINMTDQTKGIHFVEIVTNGKRITRKLVLD